MLEKTASGMVYLGGEGQTVFPIAFPFLESSHIRAEVRDGRGGAKILAAGIDYAVNLVSEGNGELILLGEALAEGSTLYINRRLPLTQEIMFHNQGPNSPRAIEEAVDKLTMIAQQLQTGIDGCLALPEGTTSEDVQEALAETDAVLSEICGKLRGMEADLAGKAERGHGHEQSAVNGLPGALAGKAAVVHGHVMSEVAGLAAALAGKVDDDDPRLSRTPVAAHAASHAAGGDDPLLPAAIGALPLPPADGKSYLAVAGGWVEYIAPSGDGGDGEGTADHSQLANRDAADQHPQSAIQHLTRDLTDIRSRIDTLDGSCQSLSAALAGKAGTSVATTEIDGLMAASDKLSLASLAENVADAAARLAGLGGMAVVADAPANGKAHARQDGGWTEISLSAGGSGEGGGLAGEIRLLPFRSGELPVGWYFCNGDRYGVATGQGAALSALPANMKTDWGIVAAEGAINLPDLFSGGNGCFLRPVDNLTRLPGSVQTDAIRNITGSYSNTSTIGMVRTGSTADSVVSGAFAAGTLDKALSVYQVNVGAGKVGDLLFDASGSVPTAHENRPVNVGMTPAIYLGV